MEQTAFYSTSPTAIEAWHRHLAHLEDVRRLRTELSEEYGGRGVWTVGEGFSSAVRVLGLDVLGEQPGDLVGENKEWRVSKDGSKDGSNMLKPNLRRKAGNEMAERLYAMRTAPLDLPGMPAWTLFGLSTARPGVFEQDGALWCIWPGDVSSEGTQRSEYDPDMWPKVKLSEYHAAREAFLAANPGQVA